MKIKDLTEYVYGVRDEMRKVTWPTRSEVRRHTMLVIALSLSMAVFFWAVDYVLNIVLETII
jgi:preprotein translocase subunit SecE